MGGKPITSIFEAGVSRLIKDPHEPAAVRPLMGAFPSPYRGASHTQRSPTYISGNQRLKGVHGVSLRSAPSSLRSRPEAGSQ
jgi:hypothetical protein